MKQGLGLDLESPTGPASGKHAIRGEHPARLKHQNRLTQVTRQKMRAEGPLLGHQRGPSALG